MVTIKLLNDCSFLKICCHFIFLKLFEYILWKNVTENKIFITKQDICNDVPYSRPNGWTKWADIFCGYSWVAWGRHSLKKKQFFSNFFIFFKELKKDLYFFFPPATPGFSARFFYKKEENDSTVSCFNGSHMKQNWWFLRNTFVYI